MPLPDCLGRVSFRRYSPLNLEVVENRTNVKVFVPHFAGRTTATFLRQIVSAVYLNDRARVQLSPGSTTANNLEKVANLCDCVLDRPAHPPTLSGMGNE